MGDVVRAAVKRAGWPYPEGLQRDEQRTRWDQRERRDKQTRWSGLAPADVTVAMQSGSRADEEERVQTKSLERQPRGRVLAEQAEALGSVPN